MSKILDWSQPISWPSGNITDSMLDPKFEGTSVALLMQEEILPGDCLNRAATAQALINFIKNNKKGYILNLDSAWGSGKTWFVRRMFLEIMKSHPACYIDAWEHDYKKEPIYIILNSIISELEKHKRSSVTDKIYAGSFWRFSKAIAPELIKAITRVDVDKVAESYNLSGKNTGITDLAGTATKYVLDQINSEEKAIIELKQLLAELIDETTTYRSDITGSVRHYPLVIIADELDRCRPDFAVEMLEAVKHIFNIPNTFFIISTHSDELKHSIKSIYGEGFSSEDYLEKFFNSKLTLSEPVIENFIKMHLSQQVKDIFCENKKDLLSYDIENLISIIKGISICYTIPLRRVQKLLIELDAIIKSADIIDNQILVVPLLCVIFIKREFPDKYTQLKDKARSVTETKKGLAHDEEKIDLSITTKAKPNEIKLQVGLHGKSKYISELDCKYDANGGRIKSRDALSTIINALHKTIDKKELNFRHSDPEFPIDYILTMNYGIAFDFTPQVVKYLNFIEFGASFE